MKSVRFISLTLAAAALSAALAGCSGGPSGNSKREVNELRQTRDAEIKQMESETGRK